MIGCSVGYLYSLMHDGRLKSRAITRRGYERGIRLISVESIRKFLAQGTDAEPADKEETPSHPSLSRSAIYPHRS